MLHLWERKERDWTAYIPTEDSHMCACDFSKDQTTLWVYFSAIYNTRNVISSQTLPLASNLGWVQGNLHVCVSMAQGSR